MGQIYVSVGEGAMVVSKDHGPQLPTTWISFNLSFTPHSYTLCKDGLPNQVTPTPFTPWFPVCRS